MAERWRLRRKFGTLCRTQKDGRADDPPRTQGPGTPDPGPRRMSSTRASAHRGRGDVRPAAGPPNSPAVPDELAGVLSRLHAALQVIGNEVATGAGLSAVDAELLVAVDRGARRITDAAEAAGTSISAASRHVDHLVERGWVSREVDPENRRQAVVTVLADGRERLEQMYDARDRAVAAILEGLGATDIRQLTDVLARVADSTERVARNESAKT